MFSFNSMLLHQKLNIFIQFSIHSIQFLITLCPIFFARIASFFLILLQFFFSLVISCKIRNVFCYLIYSKYTHSTISKTPFKFPKDLIYSVIMIFNLTRLSPFHQVRMAERSKAPDSRMSHLACASERVFWSTYVGVGSNPTSDKEFCFASFIQENN